jgi:hypothetical protein
MIAIWLYVITVVVLTFGIEKLTFFFVVVLFNFEFFLLSTSTKDTFLIQELFKIIVPSLTYF